MIASTFSTKGRKMMTSSIKAVFKTDPNKVDVSSNSAEKHSE